MIGVAACDRVFENLAVVHCHVLRSNDNRQNCWVCCLSVVTMGRSTELTRCHLRSAPVTNEVTVHLHQLLSFRDGRKHLSRPTEHRSGANDVLFDNFWCQKRLLVTPSTLLCWPGDVFRFLHRVLRQLNGLKDTQRTPVTPLPKTPATPLPRSANTTNPSAHARQRSSSKILCTRNHDKMSQFVTPPKTKTSTSTKQSILSHSWHVQHTPTLWTTLKMP